MKSRQLDFRKGLTARDQEELERDLKNLKVKEPGALSNYRGGKNIKFVGIFFFFLYIWPFFGIRSDIRFCLPDTRIQLKCPDPTGYATLDFLDIKIVGIISSALHICKKVFNGLLILFNAV